MLPSTPKPVALEIASGLRRAVERHRFPRARQEAEPLTISLGVATCPADAADSDGLVTRADQAMLAVRKRKDFRSLPVPERLSAALMAWFGALGTRRRILRSALAYKLAPAHVHLQAAAVDGRGQTRASAVAAFMVCDPQQACGATPIRGLLRIAKAKGLSVRTLDLRNSGDIAGDRSWVVGYGAWALA